MAWGVVGSWWFWMIEREAERERVRVLSGLTWFCLCGGMGEGGERDRVVLTSWFRAARFGVGELVSRNNVRV